MRRDELRALEDILTRPGDHWLEDVGLTRDDAQRLACRHRLHRIADWTCLRGRGL